jgi:hypothetical protein
MTLPHSTPNGKADNALPVNGAPGDGTAPPLLLPQHLEDLRRSGLSDLTIRACKFRSVEDPHEISRILRWDRPADNLGPCLVFPFLDAHGRDTGRQRVKPDRPRTFDGKSVKYESAKGLPNLPHFPPGIAAALADPSQMLFITEGEKKAAAATQAGFPCIGLVGVYGWQLPKSKPRALLPELAGIAWTGRPVRIVFDSDATSKPEVLWGEWHLFGVLGKDGAAVKIIRLPEGPAGQEGKPAKVGLDDYLVANGPEAFTKLAEQAIEPTKPPKTKRKRDKATEKIDDPHRLARLYLVLKAKHPDRLRIVFYREQFHRWVGTHWVAVPDAEMRGELATFCKHQLDKDAAEIAKNWQEEGDPPPVPKVTTALVSNVLQALSGGVLVPQETPQPSWLGPDASPRNYVAMQNGILDVDRFLAGDPAPLLPHTPLWFSPILLPYAFDPYADCPHWRAFLARNLGGGLPNPAGRQLAEVPDDGGRRGQRQKRGVRRADRDAGGKQRLQRAAGIIR